MEVKTENRPDISTHLTRFVFIALVLCFIAFLIYGVQTLALPIAVSLLLAFALNPAVDFLEGLGLPRALAVFIAVMMLVLIGYLGINLALPVFYAQYQEIMSQSDLYLAKIIELLKKIENVANSITPSFVPRNIVSAEHLTKEYIDPLRSGSIVSIKSDDLMDLIPEIATFSIITPIITFILLLQGHDIYNNLLSTIPNRYFEMVLQLIHKVKGQIGSYFKGLMIQWSILAVFLTVCFLGIGLPYAPFLGIFAATANIIPYLGPVIGIATAIVPALLDPSGNQVIFVVVIFAIARIADDAIIQPVILAGAVHLHPLIAVLAVITFERLFGVVGMVVAIPLVGIVMVMIEVMYKSLKAFRVI